MTTATQVEVKEKPIIFSGEMVKAILEGRKTQTRRVITNEHVKAFAPGYADDRERVLGLCPYGRVGDRLWVRETWAPHDDGVLANEECEFVYYRANDETKYDTDGRWRPPIFMPRWASRITLEITNVRVERLQEISDEDAKAEGVEQAPYQENRIWIANPANSRRYIATFRKGWDKLNAKRGYSWASNPWVWPITFKKS